ncbi:unnamed protein product [Caenorhabditis bovis]|uniref:Uncharacterized protein n=1 Tax=Caenorhabditis bovis TaxID=2654633 RepID=A0A8S1ENA1_9PELO|nr:unnamed protein product [Caenorhabditis bovis]
MASNQEPHVIYQQTYPAANYQGAPVNQVWNQPPTQAVAFIPYHPDVNYGDKPYGAYAPVAYQPTPDNGQHFQAPQFVQTQAPWQYQQQGQSQFIPSYANTFNVANDPQYQTAPLPTMSQPPPGMPREEYPGSVGVIDSSVHSAAAYTAKWVSSTSSIPPDMREEPESDINLAQWEQGQWPGLNEENKKDEKSTKKSGSKNRDEQKRELTFDERLEKAKMQKDRVENQGNDSNSVSESTPGATSPTGTPTTAAARGTSGPQRGGRGYSRGGHNGPNNRRDDFVPENRHEGGQSNYHGRGMRRGHGGPHNMGGMIHQNAPAQFQQAPVFVPQNQYPYQPAQPNMYDAQLMATMNAFQNTHITPYNPLRQFPIIPGYNFMRSPIQQDDKFRNTWLDFGFPRGRGGFRGRGRGGPWNFRGSGRRFERRVDDRRDEKRDEPGQGVALEESSKEEKPAPAAAASSSAVAASAPMAAALTVDETAAVAAPAAAAAVIAASVTTEDMKPKAEAENDCAAAENEESESSLAPIETSEEDAEESEENEEKEKSEESKVLEKEEELEKKSS